MIHAALPGLAAFPALLALVAILLFSTATLAFYIKGRLRMTVLRASLARLPAPVDSAAAALLGAATPFCTCTAVPLFLGMLEVEVPLGPAVSFLLASPTINLGAVVLLLIVFGLRVGIFYAGVCLLAAVLVGWVLGRTSGESGVREYLSLEWNGPASTLRGAAEQGHHLTRRLLPWLALATLVGILIDALIPTSAVAQLSRLGPWGVPAAAVLGSVIYADILLLIPIGYSLIQHGASVPVVLTFMLAASGLSVPELVVLGRVLHRRPLAVFTAATLLLYAGLGFGFMALSAP